MIFIFATMWSACRTPEPEPEPARYHAAGWADPAAHGRAAKLQELPCAACHGEALDGGTAGQSCDTCHAPGWRQDCTFCHGGADNETGAPPVDLDAPSPFADHTAHVEETNHAAFACAQCHATPADVLSPGHVFVGDATPGAPEVDLSRGLSPAATYAAGTCADSYCHGNGRGVLGTVQSGEALDCAGCHEALSEVHAGHLAAGAGCAECHADTAASDDAIAVPAQHVDGEVDTAFPSGVTFDGATCTGACHDVQHDGATLGRFHLEGWAEPDAHGPAALLQAQDCTVCHGADLAGGTSGESCDRCHAPGWRAECTYCHGGAVDATGAPPDDIVPGPISFPAHPAHVQETTHAAWDCGACHTEPADVSSVGHVFFGDVTPGVAEVDLSAGLSSSGTYAAGTCSNLYCHGDGRGGLGTVDVTGATDCGSCHSADTAAMSTIHGSHVALGAACGDCHAATATGDDAITGPAEHVDGEVDVVFASAMGWDGATCTGTCHDVDHFQASPDHFHPTGWDAPGAHGTTALLREQDCTTCHGAALDGGPSGVSCDTCHAPEWRTDCTYCHGGVEDETGAPPEDIGPGAISFPAHAAHVQARDHAAWGCEQCHAVPTDPFSPGHWLVDDPTPGAAEVALPAPASYASGTCSNVYCHGDGQVEGDVTVSETTDCTSCHGGRGALGTLSGLHPGHVNAGAVCGECHALTVVGDTIVTAPEQHVDGEVDVAPLGVDITFSGDTCTGSCHGIVHDGSSWSTGDFHPADWPASERHGTESLLRDRSCGACHGADLGGGSAGVSCDTCHAPGWRTDCTYCHGGDDNATGAPPTDVDGEAVAISFPEHTAHVDATATHVAWACTECHVEPVDVLSDGHVFLGDLTPGVAEVDLSAGLSSAGTYDAGTCSGVYCHGTGSQDGDVTSGAGPLGCDGCHADAADAAALGGRHENHLSLTENPIQCADCHPMAVAQHVDGELDVKPATLTWNGVSCSGTCHGERHGADPWVEGP